jgi:hypothetical protein
MDADRAEILSGPRDKDEVISAGKDGLRQGQLVSAQRAAK